MFGTLLLGAALVVPFYTHLHFEPTDFEPFDSRFIAVGSATTVRFGANSVCVGKLRISWPKGSSPQALDLLPGKTNYIIGNVPERWRRNVPNYARLAYRGVAPGIDMVFYSSPSGQLEYDWIVAPGANPRGIRLRIDGARRLRLDSDGSLVAESREGELRQFVPRVHQGVHRVSARYAIHGNQVGIELSGYDRKQTLTIDPMLVYSTYLSVTNATNAQSIALDAAGNIYAMGLSSDGSSHFGTQNVYVAKLNPTGSTLLYSTIFGGTLDESAGGVAVDAAGNAYVTGTTQSHDFPTLNPLQSTNKGGSSAFITKVNSSGAMVYSTYLGGSSNQEAHGIAVDPSGNAYIAGNTLSKDFPTANPIQAALGGQGASNVFVAKMNAAGSALVYSTYLGGSGADTATSIAIDGAGNAYVAGTAGSANFPTVAAAQSQLAGGGGDAFVAKINAVGSALVYSTYFGGAGFDRANSIAADSSGNAYIAGDTMSADLPTSAGVLQPTNNACQCIKAFVAKFNAAGARVYSTYFGGESTDVANGIAVDAAGDAFITGYTFSSTFPLLNAFQNKIRGTGDAFVSMLNPAGSALMYSSYLGGATADEGFAIAVDSAGNAYVGGLTQSPDYPVAGSPYQGTLAGVTAAFLTKLSQTGSSCVFALTPASVNLTAGASSGTVAVQGPAGCTWSALSNAPFLSVFGNTDSFIYNVAANGGTAPRQGIVNVSGSKFIVNQGVRPQVFTGGVVNAADYTPRIAAGGLISIFGAGFSTSASATVGVSTAPVIYSGDGQINAQVPFEVAGQSSATLTINAAGQSGTAPVPLSTYAPAIFTVSQDGHGTAATIPAFSVTAGDNLSLFATGLGPVSPPVPTGTRAPITPLSSTPETPVVMIGGQQALVTFSGLAPTFFGLSQVNVRIPAGIPAASAVPVTIQIGGATRNTLPIGVR